ncbi:MAG: endonuclease/exonuclease/phosphatase family protein [Clostridia bacterium]|nr:endonuclease/exonuclease/phosphatase family protein [Clostridia bacterium]MBO5416030.1 endonuclease/exonuclease/phosphatase family protein [Clostridia bacterium]
MSIEVISFNIRCANDPNGHSIDERAPRVKSVISRFDADIIGFQECTPKWLSYIEEYYSGEYEIFNKYRYAEEESAPLLFKKSRFECEDKGYFWFSDTPNVESRGWDELYNCYRICMWAILKDKKTGEKIQVINTHFGFGDNGQIKSVGLMRERARAVEYPVVMMGDFNMTPENKAYAEMTKDFFDVNAQTKNDMRDTYHGYGNGHGSHIDHFFINEGFEPMDYEMLDDTFDGKYPSDHYGIRCVIKTKY